MYFMPLAATAAIEIDVVADVLCDEAHREPVVILVQLIAEEPGFDRIPVAVADRGVEAKHDGLAVRQLRAGLAVAEECRALVDAGRGDEGGRDGSALRRPAREVPRLPRPRALDVEPDALRCESLQR